MSTRPFNFSAGPAVLPEAVLQQAAAELMHGAAIEPAPLVDLLDADAIEIDESPSTLSAPIAAIEICKLEDASPLSSRIRKTRPTG